MGKSGRIESIPLSDGEDLLLSSSVELSSSAPEFSVKINADDLAGNPVGPVGGAAGEFTNVVPVRHEHLLKSGPLGRCDDPFCSTCPSYFDSAGKHSGLSRSDHVRNAFVGGAKSLRVKAASWSKAYPGILNPHTKLVQRWNKFFCISSLIAVFVDPVFFFLLSVRSDRYCLVFNNTAAVTLTVIRSFTDTVHFLHMLLQFRLAYVAPASRVSGAGELEDDPKKIALHYMKGWFVLDLFTALPLPQTMIWTVVKKYMGTDQGANYAKDMLRVTILLQNIPRSLRFFPLLVGRSPSGFVFETAWANFVINLLMYLLAGHVVGSCWYLFGLQRVNQCFRDGCSNETLAAVPCQRSYLDCGDQEGNFPINQARSSWISNTNVGPNCLFSPTFPYGIYTTAVLVTMEHAVVNKYIYSLFWGFLQISTLAGNQTPSLFVWEVLFTMGIVGLGLLLFALLIGNMQNFLLALGRRKLEMQLRRYDVEVWMKRRRLPILLRRRVRQAERFKWVANQGVEERELLNDLPEDLQKDIQRFLCLEFVKKVRLFELLEDHVLDSICEKLYQRLYIENSEIFRIKRPVERMLFIVRGKLESRGEDGSIVPVKEGDFCGDELLSWYIDMTVQHGQMHKRPSSKLSAGKYPLSSRTVTCLTSVEAFSLEADALEYIVNHYRRVMQSPRVQGAIRYLSLHWRSSAATQIQKAWKHRQARLTAQKLRVQQSGLCKQKSQPQLSSQRLAVISLPRNVN